MAKVWITYAWDDNKNNDVDFIAQELQQAGLEIKLDKWNIGAGKRLWEQIDYFIQNPNESDAWLIVATSNSLQSEACKEEFAYALDRALGKRGTGFPVLALFLGCVDESLIPAAVRTRLFVSVTDPDWKERIKAAAEGRPHQATRPVIDPYFIKVHSTGPERFAIEVRPRAGVWAPFLAAIPADEKGSVEPSIMIEPANVPTSGGMLVNTGQVESDDNQWWLLFAGNEATPTQSYFIWCKKLPSRLVFGVNGNQPQYTVEPK